MNIRSTSTKVSPFIFHADWSLPPQRQTILTEAQIDSVLSIAEPEWQGAVIVGKWTGRLLPDVAMLRHQDIDHQTNHIHFVNQKRGRPTKVYMACDLKNHLANLKGDHEPDAPLFPGLVKTAQSNPALLNTGFKAMQRKAGLRPWSFCSLRKMFITKIVELGVPIHAVSKAAGCPPRTVRRCIGA
jgi:integrase